MTDLLFDWIEDLSLLVCSKASDSKPVKLETSCTVILPYLASAMWLKHGEVSTSSQTEWSFPLLVKINFFTQV